MILHGASTAWFLWANWIQQAAGPGRGHGEESCYRLGSLHSVLHREVAFALQHAFPSLAKCTFCKWFLRIAVSAATLTSEHTSHTWKIDLGVDFVSAVPSWRCEVPSLPCEVLATRPFPTIASAFFYLDNSVTERNFQFTLRNLHLRKMQCIYHPVTESI